MLVYSKYQKLKYAVMAVILLICITGYIVWVFNENHIVDKQKREHDKKMKEVEEFVGNRPWIPEWSELVEKRAGIPVANLSFASDSFAIPVKLIPYNMKIMDTTPSLFPDGQTYFDPNNTLSPADWKELIALLPAKVPYDYNQQKKLYKDELEEGRIDKIEQGKCSIIRKAISSCYDVKLAEVPEREMPVLAEKEKTDIQKEHEAILQGSIRRQQENEALFRKYGFKELPGFQYDYYKKSNTVQPDWEMYEPIISKIYDQLLDKFKKMTSGRMECSSAYDACTIKRVDWRIIKAGEHIKTREPIIEGQLLLTDNRQVYLLVRFVATPSTIYTVYLEGYEYRSTIDMVGRDTSPNSTRVFINPHPMLGQYNASNTYLYNSTEFRDALPKSLTEEADQITRAKTMMERNADEMKQARCYGKNAITKSECEAEYNKDGTPAKTVGIWDGRCNKNDDCPFYRANKNYPNDFGGCIQGSCQMPYGITQVSPTKYRDESRAVCYNCRGNGVDCCQEQKSRSKYPNLRSPDYRFEGDNALRRQYF